MPRSTGLFKATTKFGIKLINVRQEALHGTLSLEIADQIIVGYKTQPKCSRRGFHHHEHDFHYFFRRGRLNRSTFRIAQVFSTFHDAAILLRSFSEQRTVVAISES